MTAPNRKAAAEAASHVSIGFLQGAGFLLATVVVAFVLHRALAVGLVVVVLIVLGRYGFKRFGRQSPEVDRVIEP